MWDPFSVPHVAFLSLWACQEADPSVDDLRKIILQDSAFCSKILQAAIKASPESIDPSAPLTSALAALRFPVIRSLAIQTAKRIVEANLTSVQVQRLRELWFTSQVAGIMARCLADSLAYPDPEEAQITGLLLNVGMLALYSNDPERYTKSVAALQGGYEIVAKEQKLFASDHLQVAATLLSGWQLESFMADAIACQHLEIERCREAAVLIRIARLTREVCKSPLQLNDDILSAAERLFGFSPSETQAVFEQAGEQYRPLSPLEDNPEEVLEKFSKWQKRLTSAVFSLASQDGVCSQLVDASDVENFAEAARHLYLQNTPAQEAILFSVDLRASRLAGLPTPKQRRLVSELSAPLNAESLMGAALLSGKVRNSFGRNPSELSVLDRQLLRLCRGEGFVCVPLLARGRLVGGVALGVETAAEAENCAEGQTLTFSTAVARALNLLSEVRGAARQDEAASSSASQVSKLIHEVSNPVTIITNYLGVVGTIADDAQKTEVLGAIEGEVRRIGKILDYYRTSKDAPPPQEADIDLAHLVGSVVESLKSTCFQPKHLEVVTAFDANIPPLRSNSVALTQILVNLLKNAAEALPEGGRIALTTRARALADGGRYVEIQIHDNGPGIAAEILERLFSPVTSTKGPGHAGLGLNIVKEMAKDIGAKVSCHSAAESGTTFNVMIPTSKR